MLLAVDVGNTTTSVGAFQGERLQGHWRLTTSAQRTPDELGLALWALLDQAGLLRSRGSGTQDADVDVEVDVKVEGVIIASVVPRLNQGLVFAFERYFHCKPVFLDYRSQVIRLEVEDPSTMGADRIADCLAGFHFYGGPLLIVDFGTATTFDLVSEEGAFLGGAIAPEMGAASESLFAKTALLPEVELEPPPSVIGKNTPDNLKAGVVLGFLDLVGGLIARFRREYPRPLKVIATGGRGELFCKHLEAIETYDPHLTLKGLRLAWERQRPPSQARSVRSQR